MTESELRQRTIRASDSVPSLDIEPPTPTLRSPTNSKRTRLASPHKHNADKRFGKTPAGRVFSIPQTQGMTSLFDPRTPKSDLDKITLGVLAAQSILFCCVPISTSRYLFLAIFAIFRLAYNLGLGWVLSKQSTEKWIIKTVKRNGWLDQERKPKVYAWVKKQLVTKMGKDYSFEDLPEEFNIWLFFRHAVDIILLGDFLSYCFFAVSWLQFPASQGPILHILRWIAGWTLVFFNLWVKIDAHRVVTDLAWYWADCFFSSLQNLVFDGVFEAAPHPMYSVGYAGYYGLSLIVGSQIVLFVSLAAHACQFAFLVFFENPHIERTYGSPKPLASRTPLPQGRLRSASKSTSLAATPPKSGNRRRASSSTLSHASDKFSDGHLSSTTEVFDSDLESHDEVSPPRRKPSMRRAMSNEEEHIPISQHDLDNFYFRKDNIILSNLDIFRAKDFFLVFGIVYAFTGFAVIPRLGPKALVVISFLHAVAWRIFHSFGLGLSLKAQSENKWLVRHFLKHYHYEGDAARKAINETFSNWKAIYNFSLCMTYVSFATVVYHSYQWSHTWIEDGALLQHTLGLLLVALQIWTSQAMYEAGGRFAWFYGDFFVDEWPIQLAYTGIYRHVNNPERIMGGAAFFGLALISGSKLVAALAIFSVVSHFWFLNFVENPHMRRLYGDAVRKDAGITKTWKSVTQRHAHRAPPELTRVYKEVRGTVEKVLSETSEVLEEFLGKSKPKISEYVEDTKILLKQSGERLILTRVANVSSIDKSGYSLKLEQPHKLSTSIENLPDLPSSKSNTKLRFRLGETISVRWHAPPNHSPQDWIGIYPVRANESREITRVVSQNRWKGIRNQWDGDDYIETKSKSTVQDTDGLLKFEGKTLPLQVGSYELRYHHDGKHNVMAISLPFEVYVDKPADLASFDSVYNTVKSLVANCLNMDPNLIPLSAYELAGLDEEEYESVAKERTDRDDFTIFTEDQASRISYALLESTGADLGKEVIVAEANVSKLADAVMQSLMVLGRI